MFIIVDKKRIEVVLEISGENIMLFAMLMDGELDCPLCLKTGPNIILSGLYAQERVRPGLQLDMVKVKFTLTSRVLARQILVLCEIYVKCKKIEMLMITALLFFIDFVTFETGGWVFRLKINLSVGRN